MGIRHEQPLDTNKANKDIKSPSMPLAIKQMPMKTTIICYHTSFRMTNIFKKVLKPNAGRDVEKLHYSYIASGKAEWCRPSGKMFGSFLKDYTCT